LQAKYGLQTMLKHNFVDYKHYMRARNQNEIIEVHFGVTLNKEITEQSINEATNRQTWFISTR
jgi:hypothetical protein